VNPNLNATFNVDHHVIFVSMAMIPIKKLDAAGSGFLGSASYTRSCVVQVNVQDCVNVQVQVKVNVI